MGILEQVHSFALSLCLSFSPGVNLWGQNDPFLKYIYLLFSEPPVDSENVAPHFKKSPTPRTFQNRSTKILKSSADLPRRSSVSKTLHQTRPDSTQSVNK